MLIISGNKRKGETYCRGKEETGKKIKERAQEEGKTADERSWNLYEKGGAQKAVRIWAGSGLFNQVRIVKPLQVLLTEVSHKPPRNPEQAQPHNYTLKEIAAVKD